MSKLTKVLVTALLCTPASLAMAQEKSIDAVLSELATDMVTVEGGTFMMGATDGYGYDDERPVHEVTLTPFMMSKYEVTQQLWNLIMNDNPSTVLGDSLPVNNVCWDECQTFIAKLNQKTGKSFRLPTEAEWEFAARGGINANDLGTGNGYQYAGGYHNLKSMDPYVWYVDNSNNTPHKIGTKKPNELALFDMSGNVCEYVQDFFSLSYSSEAQQNPTGAATGDSHVYRGGSYERPTWQCRLSSRFGNNPAERREECGFRLAMDLPNEGLSWFLIADGKRTIAMSQVGMLVAVDESVFFSILDLNGHILVDNVMEVKFAQKKDLPANIAVAERENGNMLKGFVYNHLTLTGAKGMVEVFTVSGMKVKNVLATQQETDIDVSDLTSGVYVVRCGKQSFKFNKK